MILLAIVAPLGLVFVRLRRPELPTPGDPPGVTHVGLLTIAEAEQELRGIDRYLADGERLLNVMERDDLAVRQAGTDHRELGRRLGAVLSRRPARGEAVIEHEGRSYAIRHLVTWTAQKLCPFGDSGLVDDTVVRITAVGPRTSIELNVRMAHMIEAHGFYGGTTKYRVDPKLLMSVLGFQ
jgi:hypothetical protein